MEKIFKNKDYQIQGLYISAAKRNSGKTTISIAVMRLLRDKGLIVQPFKKGPDFIDPMWLSAATGKNCYNLDFYFMSKDKIKKHFLEYSLNSDISIIEGNHGLYDSFDLYGKSSNASMAKLLSLPVILVIDVGELNRGVVPLLLGFVNFDKNVNIKGVILNKVHSKRHEKNLIKAINYYTDLKVVGNIPNDPELSIKQRHLGLLSTLAGKDIENLVFNISSKILNCLDLEGIIDISRIAPQSLTKSYGNIKLKYNIITPPAKTESGRGVRRVKIGLAYDGAFNFYYNENIKALENLGCDIFKFSPLEDVSLPEVDALYIGGGFPEIFCKDLEANINLRRDIREKIETGLPVYAECGGLMYLCRSIACDGIMYEMVGAIDAGVKWTKRPKGHGYTKLTPVFYDKNGRLWFNKIKSIKGHEFHHSYLENLETPLSNNMNFAFNVEKGFGVNGTSDGIIYKNIIASYTHVFSPAAPKWFKNWVSFIKEIRKDLLKIK
ncbi:MAG: hydrogenobyrinic acid a,c-diamide synthase (glutamine-hydrolyzing) [Deltaproteobacteria bacterium]|nr:hydrogenobyrinic acid a,c-diamide synthase (glutamine-hydrolyzing) [Deltaproteobacteria bacterium]